MIRDDRELLAEPGRLNPDVVLTMGIMDGSDLPDGTQVPPTGNLISLDVTTVYDSVWPAALRQSWSTGATQSRSPIRWL